jgi:hypothetical protein
MPIRARTNSQTAAPSCILAKSSIGAKTVFALSFLALCVVELPSGSAQAGFFEDLFGAFSGEQTGGGAQRYYGDADRSGRAARRHRSSLSYMPKQSHSRRHALALTGADKQAGAGIETKDGLCYAAPPQGADPFQSDAILHDATLREGDSVMTVEGLRVFQGGSACPHKASDFLALAEARDVSKSQRGALLAIENAVKTPISSPRAGRFLDSGPELAQQP